MASTSTESIIPLPDKIQLLHDRDAMIIRRKWFSPLAIFLAFFATFWNGFMIVWMTMALRSEAWPMAAFGSIHACVGIGLAYYCLASFLNTTDISVDPNYLQVRHYPLPWGKRKKIRVHEIKQLYSKEHVTRNKNGMSVSYRLYVITNDNREKRLLSGLQELSHARFMEREIENILGLEDLPVAGEYRK